MTGRAMATFGDRSEHRADASRWKIERFSEFFSARCADLSHRRCGTILVSSPPKSSRPLSLKIASLSHVAAIDQAVAAGSAKTKRFCSMGNRLFDPGTATGDRLLPWVCRERGCRCRRNRYPDAADGREGHLDCRVGTNNAKYSRWLKTNPCVWVGKIVPGWSLVTS